MLQKYERTFKKSYNIIYAKYIVKKNTTNKVYCNYSLRHASANGFYVIIYQNFHINILYEYRSVGALIGLLAQLVDLDSSLVLCCRHFRFRK